MSTCVARLQQDGCSGGTETDSDWRANRSVIRRSQDDATKCTRLWKCMSQKPLERQHTEVIRGKTGGSSIDARVNARESRNTRRETIHLRQNGVNPAAKRPGRMVRFAACPRRRGCSGLNSLDPVILKHRTCVADARSLAGPFRRGCRFLWRRENGRFRGASPHGCGELDWKSPSSRCYESDAR